jgi:hypothetical protein
MHPSEEEEEEAAVMAEEEEKKEYCGDSHIDNNDKAEHKVCAYENMRCLDDHQFDGVGVQYYLGFHHGDDLCRGRVVVSNGHFVALTQGSRMLGAYFLGCEVANRVQEVYLSLLHQSVVVAATDPATALHIHHQQQQQQQDDNDNTNNVDLMININNTNTNTWVHITKENLILLDPDILSDYAPETEKTENPSEDQNGPRQEQPFAFHFVLPKGYKLLLAKDIPPNEMPYVLQRAKIVLDLALPGVERLAGESILMGT